MKLCFACTIILLASLHSIRAQEASDSDTGRSKEVNHALHYVYSTRPLPPWHLHGSFGGDITLLPQPITEYPTPAPSLDLRGRLSLPLNLMAYGRAASNIATSFLQAGLCWSVAIENFSVGFGWSAAYMYGNLTFVDGFNTSQHRWTNYPMVTGTAKFNNAVFTTRIEAELMTSLTRRIENQVSQVDNDVYNGASITIAVEQPFWRNTHVLLGTTLSFSSNPYQSWFLYNTFRDRLLSTEFFMGFML